jgi:hypothetical protein
MGASGREKRLLGYERSTIYARIKAGRIAAAGSTQLQTKLDRAFALQ